MAGQGGGVRHHHMAADMTIMGDMHVRHQHVMVAQARDPAAKDRRTIDRDIFPEDVVMADPHQRLLALIL